MCTFDIVPCHRSESRLLQVLPHFPMLCLLVLLIALMSWRSLHFRILLDELQSSLQWLWSLQPHSAQEALYWPDIQNPTAHLSKFWICWSHLLLSCVWNQPSRIPVPLSLWDAWWPDKALNLGNSGIWTTWLRFNLKTWSYPCHANIIKSNLNHLKPKSKAIAKEKWLSL